MSTWWLRSHHLQTGVNVDDYEFLIDFNSAMTGLFWDNDRDGMCYPSPGPRVITWATLNNGSTSFSVIRCGNGERRNPGIVVKARPENEPANEMTAYSTGRLPQGKHRDVLQMTYSDQTGRVQGTMPAYLNGVDIYALSIGTEIANAVERWNDAAGYTIFYDPPSAPAAADVVKVKGYWHMGRTDDSEKCDEPASVACMKRSNIVLSTSHLLPHTVWLKFPPAGQLSDGTVTKWTSDLEEAEDPRNVLSHVYLPMVLTHEFGHTFGLGHSRNGNLMQGGAAHGPIPELTDNDIYGFEQAIESHSH